MVVDASIGNCYDAAINDVMDMLGIARIPDIQILKEDHDRMNTLNALYRCLLGLCLGSHFTDNRKFIDPMICKISIIDDGKLDRYLEINHAFKIFIHLHLESLHYSRLAKITLDQNQDPRELFLALAFLISEDNWFDRVDRNSGEYKELKDFILEFASKNDNIFDNNDMPILSKSRSHHMLRSNTLSTFKSLPTNKTNFNMLRSLNTSKSTFSNPKSFGTMRGIVNFNTTDMDRKAGDLTISNDLLEKNITSIVSDVMTRLHILAKRKTVSDFDSELLRLIAGKSEYDKQFLRLMDDITRLLEPEEENTDNITSTKVNSSRSEPSKEHPAEFDPQLVKELTKLCNIIIQLQSRLYHLSTSIERDDVERLKHFANLMNQWKEYEKCTADTNSVYKYKKPTPMELILISNDNLFKRHMAILKMMDKALENEIRRKELWKTSTKVLNKIEATNTNISVVEPTDDEQKVFRLITKPSDIKYNVHVVKSFLVEGIPSHNFKNVNDGRKSSVYYSVIDFLRQVNNNFANHRAARVADKKGRKTPFYKYILSQVTMAERRGILDPDLYESTNTALTDFLHLFEDITKFNLKLSMTKLKDMLNLNSELTEAFSDELVDFNIDTLCINEEEDLLEHEDFTEIENILNGKKSTTGTKMDVKHRADKINDLFNLTDFDYYFNLYKRNFELKKDGDIVYCGSYLNFTDLVKEKLNEASDKTKSKQDKSIRRLLNVCDEITKNTSVVFN